MPTEDEKEGNWEYVTRSGLYWTMLYSKPAYVFSRLYRFISYVVFCNMCLCGTVTQKPFPGNAICKLYLHFLTDMSASLNHSRGCNARTARCPISPFQSQSLASSGHTPLRMWQHGLPSRASSCLTTPGLPAGSSWLNLACIFTAASAANTAGVGIVSVTEGTSPRSQFHPPALVPWQDDFPEGTGRKASPHWPISIMSWTLVLPPQRESLGNKSSVRAQSGLRSGHFILPGFKISLCVRSLLLERRHLVYGGLFT